MQPGERYGRLTAISADGRTKAGAPAWLFKCDCGVGCKKHAWAVRTGLTQSCGCLQKERTTDASRARGPAIAAGQRFGRLVAIKDVTAPSGRTRWSFLCDCGTETHACVTDVASGHTTSCGCRIFLKSTIQHGETVGRITPEYVLWKNMKARCYNPNNEKYADYGGRGIYVCDDWLNSFDAFLAHIGRRPNAKMSIDRIDNDGPYAPGNVRWATPLQQRHNRRPLKTKSKEAA